MRLSLSPIWGSWVLVEIFLLLLLVIIIRFQPRYSSLSVRRKRILVSLRVLAWFLLVLLFHLPSAVYTTVESLPASLALLMDQSQSMSVPDEWNNTTRFDRIRQTITSSAGDITRLREAYELDIAGFDGGRVPYAVEKGAIQFPDRPEGKETALGTVLEQTLTAHAGKRLTGIILMSDGSQRSLPPNDTLPMTAALRLRDAGIPVYTVRLGRPGNLASMRDVAVTDLICNDRVFTNNELQISGQIRVVGYRGQEIPIILLVEGKEGAMTEVDRQTVVPDLDGESVFPYRFAWRAEGQGQKKIQISIPAQDHELLGTNNEMGTFVTVVEGGLSVLYVEGTRRFEQKFLRMSLDSSADIHVDYWRSSPDGTIRPEGKTEAERVAMVTAQRGSLVPKCLVPGRYNTYIIGDMDASAWKPEELTALRECVSSGSGLILLGGSRAFASGGFAETPLAEMVPFVLKSSDRIPLGFTLEQYRETLPISRQPIREGPVWLVPDPGEPHYLTTFDLDPAKNREHWLSLEPLDSLYRAGEVKPAARVLLWGQEKKESGVTATALPALVTGSFGMGRVAALMADSTWKWYANGSESEHKQFWRRMILWTAGVDELPEGELAISLDSTRIDKGGSLDFQVRYRPREGEKVEDFDVKAEVRLPDDSRRSVSLLDESGVRTGTFRETDQPGDYCLEATLVRRDSGTEQVHAQSRFIVRERNLELDQPAATVAVMENLAEVTGGRSLVPEEFPDLLHEILAARTELAEVRETVTSLYDTWPFFLTLTGLLSLEWFLRKRWCNIG